MRQFGARVWLILTIILLMVVIAWIIKWFLSKSDWLTNKISLFWNDKIKSFQVRKKLKEDKETIINPNTEDTKTDEEFQKVIETAVAEKTEEEDKEKVEEKEEKKESKKEEKSENKSEGKTEPSVFDETPSLDTPSEKVLDDKEKKLIDRIVIEATTLKNWWKYDEYEKRIIEWLAVDPSNLELTKMLADYYFTIWSYKKALPLLKKIIERVP